MGAVVFGSSDADLHGRHCYRPILRSSGLFEQAGGPRPYEGHGCCRCPALEISTAGRGNIRPRWEMLYNHYVNRVGMSAPYTTQFAELVSPEGGGGDYGGNSGGFDQLGIGTLTYTIDPACVTPVPTESAVRGDVNNSGTVDIVDALLVAQYYVGLISSFPC
jgi:hypothetical protein